MKCDSPFYVLPKAGTEKVPVPCGRCPNCKLRRVNGWVFRLLEEDKVSSSAHFVMLTYDTRSVPITENGFLTLRKKDFQDYMKRLRKLTSNKLKYYAVGEYGSKGARPHYHAIIFNVPDTQMFYDAWHLNSDPIGGVYVGSVSSDSIAYTMKYIDKANFKQRHHRDDRLKEFSLMSKGLGSSYLDRPGIKAYHTADLTRMYMTKLSGHKIAMPRYYRNKLYTEQEMKLQALLVANIVEAADRNARLHHNHSMLYDDLMESEKYGRYQHFYSNQKDRDL